MQRELIPTPRTEQLPTLPMCQQMIENINSEIASLQQRREFWEQLGHRVVEHMIEEQTYGNR